jgi:hypothetical protein
MSLTSPYRNYTLDHLGAVALVSRKEPKPDHDGYWRRASLLTNAVATS